MDNTLPPIAIVMGSKSDWPTMQCAADLIESFDIPFTAKVVSAHRTPKRLFEFGSTAHTRGCKVIIAGAGGAAHLPGMVAALTPLPVIGVPIQSKALNGIDSLLSIAQMPKGVAVATQAIGTSGAFNAGLLAVQMLATHNEALLDRLIQWRETQTQSVDEEMTP